MMENWGDKGLTPTQRLLRCFAELDTAKIKNTDRNQLLASIQKDYGVTPEEAKMLVAEKEADVNIGKWGSTKFGSTTANKQQPQQRKTDNKQQPQQQQDGPEGLLVDPLSSQLMVDPVILPCGHSFSHSTLTQWLQKQKKCPSCSQPATIEQIKPNFALANVINHFMQSGGDEKGGEKQKLKKMISSSSGGITSSEKRKKAKKKREQQSTVEITFYSKDKKKKKKKDKSSSGDFSKEKSIPLLLYEGWESDSDREDSAKIVSSKSDLLDLKYSHQRMRSSPELANKRSASKVSPDGMRRLVVKSKPIKSKSKNKKKEKKKNSESDGSDDSSSEGQMDSSGESDGNGSEKESDEFLLALDKERGSDYPKGTDLSLSLHAEFPQLNSEGQHSLLVVASIKAPIKTIVNLLPKPKAVGLAPSSAPSSPQSRIVHDEEEDESGELEPLGVNQRAPVAIVAVIDRSSSMRGEKMALVKTALRFLVQQLSADDYVGIVSYDGSVCTETKMTQLGGKGKSKVLGAIENIDTGFMTNLSGGLFTGLKLFKQLPSNTNLVPSLLLFTDGLANKGILNRRELITTTEDKLRKIKAKKGISPTLFTFGFGSEPDSQTLSQIAETSNGLYYAIDNAEGIPVAFVDCLGGLLSVCAEELYLELETTGDVYIEKLYWKDFKESSKTTRSGLDLGDIYFEESRDLVFSVKLPHTNATDKFDVLKARLSYICLPERKTKQLSSALTVARPSVMNMSFETQKPNPVVDRQRNRITAVEAIRKSVQKQNKGNYAKAEKVLQRGMEKIRRSSTRTDYFCRSLVDNLSECLRRTKSSRDSKANNDTAYQNSLLVAHSRQRSTHTNITYRTRNKSKALSTFKVDGEFSNSGEHNIRKSKSQVDSYSQNRVVKKRPGHVSSNSDGKIKYNPLELVGEEKVKYVLEQSKNVYDKIQLIVHLMEGECTATSCPKMCAGKKYEFLWKDEPTGKIIPLSAPGYIQQLLDWSLKEFDRSENEYGIGPATQHLAAERAFMATIKNVMRRLFRVYAHVFYHHKDAFEKMGELPLLQNSFTQFISFVKRFSLADPVDLEPLKLLIDTLNV